jgi:IS1 family transposase
VEPDSTKRQLKNTDKEEASATSGNPPKRPLLPVFEDDSSHQQVGKSSGELAHVERFFGRLRQKLARYVRRTRAASESERMLHLTTKLLVEWYNEAVT